MEENTQALSTIVESIVDLALSGWLDEHKRSLKTYNAYKDTIEQFRAGFQLQGIDLDTASVQSIMLLAQIFVSTPKTKPDGEKTKEQLTQSTINTRLAILGSFFDYAISRELILPFSKAGHVVNPIKGIRREKVQRYKGVHAIEPEEAMERIQGIDRSTLTGKRDYAVLSILLQTGRRLHEVTDLQWQHVQLSGRGKK